MTIPPLPDPRLVTVADGVELSVTDTGDGPPVILVHGFPELAFSWRHQIPAVAAAGHRVLAPDMRGYGRSARPGDIADYGIMQLTGDLLALLDDIGEDKAVFVGHDWGSMVVWQMALLHPDRVAGVVGMSVPFLPRGPMPPVEMMRQIFADNFFYIVYFQEPGVADAELGADASRTMRRMLAGVGSGDGDPAAMFAADGGGFVDRIPEPSELPDWLSQQELDVYCTEFTRTGFTGGINWYRNLDANWHATEHLDGAKVEVPAAFIGGSADPVLLMSPPAAQDEWLTDHRGTTLIDGAGHWVQQEAPDETNAALLAFLASL